VCVEYETNQKVVSVNTRDAYVPLLLLTTKESNVSSSIFSGPPCISLLRSYNYVIILMLYERNSRGVVDSIG